jgi:hypothetical protein
LPSEKHLLEAPKDEDENRMAIDVITGKQYDLSSNVPLEPRATLVLEF